MSVPPCIPDSPLPQMYKYRTVQDKQIINGDGRNPCRRTVKNEGECKKLCDDRGSCTGYDMYTFGKGDTDYGSCAHDGTSPCCLLKQDGLQALRPCIPPVSPGAPPSTSVCESVGTYPSACHASYSYKNQGVPGEGSNSVLWILIIVFLLLAVGFGVWYWKKHSKMTGGRPLNCVDINPYGY